MNKTNIILLLVVVLIVVAPLFIVKNSEFGGADGKANDMIAEIAPDYEPWFEPFWTPPGGETEGLLFALQAAIGSGVFFYCLGLLKGKQNALKAIRDEKTLC